MEDMSRYDLLMKEASKSYVEKRYDAAVKNYSDALEIAKGQLNKKIVCQLKYIVAFCLVQSDKLDDLAEAIMILQSIDSAMQKKFPNVYLVLALAHCKLFRFKEASSALSTAESMLSSTPKYLLEEFTIPASNIKIEQNIHSDFFKQVKAECRAYKHPDAVCYFKICNHITKPYATPNQNIYKKDPAFDGMVVVKCNNSKRPCTLYYHKWCWINQKDQLYEAEKITDKDFLGHPCFKNCRDGQTLSRICYIEIIGANGQTETCLETPGTSSDTNENSKQQSENNFGTSWDTNENSKGVKRDSKQRPKNYYEQKSPVHRENYHEAVDGNEDLVVVINNDFHGNINFSHDYPELAQKKIFLLSYFEEYIKNNNVVRVIDIHTQYADLGVTLPHTDILNFLLATGKIKLLGDQAEIPVQQDYCNYSYKSKDPYDDIMSDAEDVFTEGPSTSQECKLKNVLENYASDKAGGDAPALQKVSDKPVSVCSQTSSANSSTIQLGRSTKKRESESKKLTKYINQLEADIKQVMAENEEFKQVMVEDENLKKELATKNAEIEQLRKKLENEEEKWKPLQEKIVSFKQKYEDVKRENLTLKTEVIDLLKTKLELEEKLVEMENPEICQKELLKNFEEEFLIIEEKINSEWEAKSKKLVSEALEPEIETRIALLNKCLNYQYSCNRHLINGLIDKCNVTLEVIGKINEWMGKNMAVKQFLDNTMWSVSEACCNQALFKTQEEYKAFTNKLHDEESMERFEMRDIALTYPDLPNLPSETISDYVLKALDTFYERQCSILKNLQQNPDCTLPPVYPVQQRYPLSYPQIMPPPGIYSQRLPPPGMQPLPPTHNFNSYPHPVNPMDQYKQQAVMQQQMQSLQQEVQQMRRQLEQKSQVSYPESLSSGHKSLTNSVGQLLSLEITPVEVDPPVEEPRVTSSKDKDDYNFVIVNGKKVVYDTGSYTESESTVSRDTPVLQSTDNLRQWHNEQVQSKSLLNAPSELLKNSIENLPRWNDEQSQSKSSLNSALTWQKWSKVPEQPRYLPKRCESPMHYREKEQEQPATLKRHAESYDHWDNKEKQPVPSKKSADDGSPYWQKTLIETGLLKSSNKENYSVDTEIRDEDNNQTRQYSDYFQHKPEKIITSRQSAEFEDIPVVKYLLEDNNAEKREKRPNLDALVNRLKARYPGTSDGDIISIISEIRKRHNNSLTGMTVGQIVQESEDFFEKNQHIHLIRYFSNGTSETSAKISGLQHLRTDSGSSSSYHTATRGPSSVQSSNYNSKYTWSAHPPEEMRYVTGGDCSICNIKLNKNNCFTLNCGHSFHKMCAASRFQSERSCPNCHMIVSDEYDLPLIRT